MPLPDYNNSSRGMKVAIVGSRRYPLPDLVRAIVDTLPVGTVVISGGAPGVDSVAEEVARGRGLDCIIFPADWETHGRAAGPIRNSEIVAHSDCVIAFWNGESRGTVDTVRKAMARRLPVKILGPDGKAIALDVVFDPDAAAR